MPTGEVARRAQATQKAIRNARAAARRRRGLTPVASWQRWRRCTGCGRYVSEGQTSAWGAGLRWCELCVLDALLRGHGRAGRAA